VLVVFRSPSNEFWDAQYEIPGLDDEADSLTDVSDAVDIELDKDVSNNDDSASDISSQTSQTSMAQNSLSCADVPLRNYSLTQSQSRKVPLTPDDVSDKKKVPLGKQIRDYARGHDVRSRDLWWRERSVSRARDCLVASKRKTVGLPAVFRRPADDRFPSAMPPPRQAGVYRHGRDSGPRMPPPRLQFANDRDRRAKKISSVNVDWLAGIIKVRLVLC